jgi:hypothetical protein
LRYFPSILLEEQSIAPDPSIRTAKNVPEIENEYNLNAIPTGSG